MKRIIIFIYLFLLFIPRVSFAKAERIVSLSPAITEIIFSLGADNALVGVSSYCDWPIEARTKEKVGGFINPNIEKILSLNPDLVILSPNSGTKQIQKTLATLGIKNLIVSFYTIDELRKAYMTIGEHTGYDEQAQVLIHELDRAIETVRSKAEEKSGPRMLFVRSHTPLYLAGSGTYEDDLITIGGGINCITNSRIRYPHYTIESIIELDPEIIIDATYYETPGDEQIEKIRAFWLQVKNIRAVKDKRVYVILTDIHSVPGPRTPEMLEIVSMLINRDGFEKQQNRFISVFDNET